MRRRILMIVAGLILATTFAYGINAQIEKTEYQEGHFWKYDFWLEHEGFHLTGDVEYRVMEQTQANGYDVQVIGYQGDGTFTGMYSGDWEMKIDYFHRLSDHATVKHDGYLEMTFKFLGETHTIVSQREEVYNPPLDMNDFPIELGETWNASTEVSERSTLVVDGVAEPTETDTYDRNYEIECLEEIVVTVPAGMFTGYKVKATRDDGSYMIQVITPDEGMVVLDENFDEDGTKSGSMELRSHGMEEETLMPFWVWLLILIVIMVIIVAIAAAASAYSLKRRQREEQKEPFEHWQEPPR